MSIYFRVNVFVQYLLTLARDQKKNLKKLQQYLRMLVCTISILQFKVIFLDVKCLRMQLNIKPKTGLLCKSYHTLLCGGLITLSSLFALTLFHWFTFESCRFYRVPI